MVAWLASDLCTFSTGATFDLSGGAGRRISSGPRHRRQASHMNTPFICSPAKLLGSGHFLLAPRHREVTCPFSATHFSDCSVFHFDGGDVVAGEDLRILRCGVPSIQAKTRHCGEALRRLAWSGNSLRSLRQRPLWHRCIVDSRRNVADRPACRLIVGIPLWRRAENCSPASPFPSAAT